MIENEYVDDHLWLDTNCFKRDPLLSGAKAWLLFSDATTLVYRRTADAPIFAGMLDLVGGGAEPKETPFDCITREIAEETQIIISEEHVIAALPSPSMTREGTIAWFFDPA